MAAIRLIFMLERCCEVGFITNISLNRYHCDGLGRLCAKIGKLFY